MMCVPPRTLSDVFVGLCVFRKTTKWDVVFAGICVRNGGGGTLCLQEYVCGKKMGLEYNRPGCRAFWGMTCCGMMCVVQAHRSKTMSLWDVLCADDILQGGNIPRADVELLKERQCACGMTKCTT